MNPNVSQGAVLARVCVPSERAYFDIDAEAVGQYERWLDMSVVPVPQNTAGVESDVERNHVLHNPVDGLAATAEKFGIRIGGQRTNIFW